MGILPVDLKVELGLLLLSNAAAVRERDTVVGVLREECDRLKGEVQDLRSDNM